MTAYIRSCISPIILIASLSALAAAASLSISPAIAPPGSKISARGSGFSPSETVTLAFDTASAGSATADSSGNFIAPIFVPKSAQPGAHTIQATGQTSGSAASAKLKVQTNWPSFKNLPTRTGVNPVENTISPSNGKFLTLAWQGQMGDLVDHSSPAIVNGVVYVGSFDGKLYAFNANGCAPQTLCQPLWSGATGNDITSSPAVANGNVFIGSADHKLYAFAANGCGQSACSPLWTGMLGGSIIDSSPLVANGIVYVGSFDGKFYAFAASGCGTATCSPLWTATTGGPEGGAGGSAASGGEGVELAVKGSDVDDAVCHQG